MTKYADPETLKALVEAEAQALKEACLASKLERQSRPKPFGKTALMLLARKEKVEKKAKLKADPKHQCFLVEATWRAKYEANPTIPLVMHSEPWFNKDDTDIILKHKCLTLREIVKQNPSAAQPEKELRRVEAEINLRAQQTLIF